MVDLQTIGVLMTGVSVTVAAVYYMITLRETLRNRRVTLAARAVSVDGSLRWAHIMTMEWVECRGLRRQVQCTDQPRELRHKEHHLEHIRPNRLPVQVGAHRPRHAVVGVQQCSGSVLGEVQAGRVRA